MNATPATARTGVVLVNLGTPDEPTPGAVRRYLREFLGDPRVLDIGSVRRRLLLELVILPFRPKRSAAAYRLVWTREGSPLLVHGRALERALRAELGDRYDVELGMRYGRPSLRGAIGALEGRGCERLVVLPLYPHEASSSTGSSLEEAYRAAGTAWNVPSVVAIPPFFADAGYLGAWTSALREELSGFDADHVLFSFHGLPERHVRKADASGAWCLARPDCCDVPRPANRRCYRAQCVQTAQSLAIATGLDRGRWSVAFQSRLGRTPWIRPYTDVVVRDLAAAGARRLLACCPGFVADCLETLEEIGLRARDDFRAHGGEDLRLVPSLNARPEWVRAVAAMVRSAAG